MTLPELIETLKTRLGEALVAVVEFRGETTVCVAREKIVELCTFLKKDAGFDMITDLSACDNYGETPRYQVAYQLYSMRDQRTLRVRVGVSEDDATIDTVCKVWRGANWLEREVFDMYGIRFNGHPNLKRILMWEGYPHHPLRKDFPLAGAPADLPDYGRDVGQTARADMLGGPFVTPPGTQRTIDREPRQFDTAAERTDSLAGPTKQEPV